MHCRVEAVRCQPRATTSSEQPSRRKRQTCCRAVWAGPVGEGEIRTSVCQNPPRVPSGGFPHPTW
eukprot:1680180-Pyramimonas_sp.AAC.1